MNVEIKIFKFADWVSDYLSALTDRDKELNWRGIARSQIWHPDLSKTGSGS